MTNNITAPLIASTKPERLLVLKKEAKELWNSHGFTKAEERFFVHVLESNQPFIKIPSKYRKFLIEAVTLFRGLRDERNRQQAS